MNLNKRMQILFFVNRFILYFLVEGPMINMISIYKGRRTPETILSESILKDKNHMNCKCTCFEGVMAIKRAVTTVVRGFQEELIQQCTEARQRRMKKGIRFKGVALKGKPFSFSFGIEIKCV